MKKIEIKSTGIQLNEIEIKEIYQCLKYCWHRWTKHNNSGIRKAIGLIELEILIEDIERLNKKWESNF